MNNRIRDKLSDLTFELKKYHRRYRSSFRNAVIFYVFIIVFLLTYAGILGYKIQELAEPRTAAALIGSKVIVAPEYGRDLDPVAELVAQSTIRIFPLAFQQIGDSARMNIDASAETLSRKISEQYLMYLNTAAANAIRRENAGKDFEKRLLDGLSDQMDHTALDEYLRTKYAYSLPYFHTYINRLRRKPVRELSKKEYVERDILLCWLFLLDNDRYKDTDHAAALFEITSSVPAALEEIAKERAKAR